MAAPTQPRRRLPGLTVKEGYTPHPFDLENGVRTSGLVAGRHLHTGHAHARHATAYYGVAPSVFHRMIERWSRTSPAASLNETTFIDVGAGMGRAVLLAAELPFQEVIGVEMHPALVRVAKRNVAAWRKGGRAKAPMRVVEADAVEFPYPEASMLIFLFNPFGSAVLRRVLKALARAAAGHPGGLDILYVNHEQEWVLEQARGFSRLFCGKVMRSAADAAADKRILEAQPEGEYASAPHEDCSIWRWTGA